MPAAAGMREVRTGNVVIRYELTRKAVKNVNLRIHPDGRVCVSANRYVPAKDVDAFVIQKADFILSALNRFANSAPPRDCHPGDSLMILGNAVRIEVVQGHRDTAVLTDGILRLTLRDPSDEIARKRLTDKLLIELCRTEFPPILARMHEPFGRRGIPLPTLRIRSTTSRWGSCIPAKCAVTLNSRLIHAPLACIEYVALHELCHLIHPNHGPHFYKLLTALMPSWQNCRAVLKRNAHIWLTD